MVKTFLFVVFCFALVQCQTNSKKEETKYVEKELKLDEIYPIFETNKQEEEIIKIPDPPTIEELEAIKSANDKYSIEYGFSFGECIGYCHCSIQFTSNGILKTSTSWGNEPKKVECFSIQKSDYDYLINSIDFNQLLHFSEYLGCGDCADAGSETLRIRHKDKTVSFSGTYGYKVEYAQELLDFLRSI